MSLNKKIGFIGAGNMAEALMSGILKTGLVNTTHLMASDISNARRKYISKKLKINTVDNNIDIIKHNDVIIFAVKPNMIKPILQEIGLSITTRHLLISIAAGIRIAMIEKYLKGKIPVIRIMPNTPALVLAGISAISKGTHAKQMHLKLAEELLAAVGKVVILPEKLLDIVTGLSGSGPAYVFEFIDALSAAGIKKGLSRDIALLLSAQTVFGAAKMVLETGEHPAILRDKVTSPGGTTLSGLHALENGEFRAAVMNAITAATRRAKELSDID